MFKPEQVKRNIVDDPRYDAVGSSSLREELFNTYLKAHGGSGKQTVTTSVPEAEKPDSATMTQEEKERQRREPRIRGPAFSCRRQATKKPRAVRLQTRRARSDLSQAHLERFRGKTRRAPGRRPDGRGGPGRVPR